MDNDMFMVSELSEMSDKELETFYEALESGFECEECEIREVKGE